MAFDLKRIAAELSAAPIASPYPQDLSTAIVNDCFRRAGEGVAPVKAAAWKKWASSAGPLWEEQLGILAHLLASTSLRDESVRALGAAKSPVDVLPGFFEAIAPLTAEMVRSNAFRQEEFLRKWAAAFGGAILGETEEQSRRRLEQLDYRTALKEYEAAEKARKEEVERRAKLLQEAEEREAAARGWRE